MVATVIPIILNDISYLTVSLVRRPITASRILLNTAKFLQILILLVIETNYKANLEKKLEKQCRRPEIIFMTWFIFKKCSFIVLSSDGSYDYYNISIEKYRSKIFGILFMVMNFLLHNIDQNKMLLRWGENDLYLI